MLLTFISFAVCIVT